MSELTGIEKTLIAAHEEILRLRGVLASRAVPDEDVVEILARAAFDQEYWNETDAERDRMWRKNDHPGNRWRERSRAGAKALRASGFSVVRTEARDGGK